MVRLAVWAVAMVTLPAPLAARILLLAPLVIVPRLLSAIPDRRWIVRLAGWPAFAAAVPLLVAISLPPGPAAAAATLPWLAVTLIAAVAAIVHGIGHLPSIVRPRELPTLGLDVALGFLAVGGAFLAIERLGADIGFSPTIVLLTATHFHVAGFGLLVLASLLAAERPWLRASVAGLIVGMPITAAGFVLASDAIGAVGAVVVGLSGIGVGLAFVTVGGTEAETARVRWVWRLAGTALLIGMPMGIAWSVAILAGQTFLDLDTMIRTHGVLNATAIVLGAVSARRGAA